METHTIKVKKRPPLKHVVWIGYKSEVDNYFDGEIKHVYFGYPTIMICRDFKIILVRPEENPAFIRGMLIDYGYWPDDLEDSELVEELKIRLIVNNGKRLLIEEEG